MANDGYARRKSIPSLATTKTMSSEPSVWAKSLKRGSACQTCRKRKLRCTGEKPTCKTCLKNSQECVYDEIPQPKTRIKKLEDKISRLEFILTQSGPSQVGPSRSAPATERKKSAGSFPYPTMSHVVSEGFPEISPPERQAKRDGQKAFSQAFHELWGMSTTASVPENFGFFGDQNMPDFSVDQMAPSGLPAQSVDQETEVHVMDVLNKLIGDSNSAGATSVEPWEFNLGLMGEGNMTKSPTEPYPIDLNLFASLGINQDDYQSVSPSMGAPQSQMLPPDLLPTPAESSPSNTASSAPTDNRSAALRAFVLDREELPREIRDSLIHIFFEKRTSFGVVLDVERFWRRVESPVEEDQPHPAFLFAMFLCAGQFSRDEAVRSLDQVFFDLAKKKLDEGTAHWDLRVIDLIRAATVLSAASYSKAKFQTAWIFGGIAMRLISSANLQFIHFPYDSLSTKYPKPNTRNPNRRRWRDKDPTIPSPKDSVELGEYIWAFWMAFSLDRCGSTATGFAPALGWTEIETPFPLPMSKYADLDAINSQPKSTAYQLFDESQPTLDGDLTGSCPLIALFILSEAARLQEEFIQPSMRDDYLATPVSSPQYGSPISVTTSADSPYRWGPLLDSIGPIPDEITRLQNALSKFVRSLPAEYINPGRQVLGGVPPWRLDPMLGESPTNGMTKTPSEVWGVDPETVLLHTQIHTAFALIYQERSDYDPDAWVQAVKSSRSVVKILHIIAEIDFSRLGFFILVCWRIVGHVLLEEVKRQRTVGNEEEALHITIDIDLIVLAMKRIGEVYAIGREIAIRHM